MVLYISTVLPVKLSEYSKNMTQIFQKPAVYWVGVKPRHREMCRKPIVELGATQSHLFNHKISFLVQRQAREVFQKQAGRDRNYLKAFAIYPLNPKWGSEITEINKADLSQNHKRIEVGLDEALGNHLVQPYEYLNTAHLFDLKLLRDKTK